MEELWKTKPDATFDDLENQQLPKEDVQSTLLVYTDGCALWRHASDSKRLEQVPIAKRTGSASQG